jgi:hypothetical protein
MKTNLKEQIYSTKEALETHNIFYDADSFEIVSLKNQIVIMESLLENEQNMEILMIRTK